MNTFLRRFLPGFLGEQYVTLHLQDLKIRDDQLQQKQHGIKHWTVNDM